MHLHPLQPLHHFHYLHHLFILSHLCPDEQPHSDDRQRRRDGRDRLCAFFAPEESLAFFQQPVAGAVPVLLQLTGALYLGFAFMNWTAKGSVLGGTTAGLS
ncbi:MAG: hypothetical protein IPF78_11570 [Flavobacteriales bacterium]|nr:hypothetical protein [Flavobacteriales bacterium]